MKTKAVSSGFQEYSLKAADLLQMAKRAGVPYTTALDTTYYFISIEDWKKVIEDCRKNMPSYVEDRRDCENLAAWFQTKVNEKYCLNTMGMALLKNIPHAINLFVAADTSSGLPTVTFVFVEPQTGEMQPFINDKWKIEDWEMG